MRDERERYKMREKPTYFVDNATSWILIDYVEKDSLGLVEVSYTEVFELNSGNRAW